jgi:hypothetical protein
MAARVCKDCNSKLGVVGCGHWENWPENIDQPHDWTDQIDVTMKVTCRACGLVTTLPDLAQGKTESFRCPKYILVRPGGDQAPD